MIRIEVEPYCNDCPAFEPDVERPTKILADNEYVYISDTVVRCENRGRCASFMRYLERRLKSEKSDPDERVP